MVFHEKAFFQDFPGLEIMDFIFQDFVVTTVLRIF